MQKYEILKDETKAAVSQPAYRIRALRDIPEHKVKVGDLGGYVEGEHNLAHEGGAWVANEAMVVDRSRVMGNALARDYSIISGHTILDDEAVVGGFTTTKDHTIVRGNARVRGGSTLEDTVLVEGNVDIRQTLNLGGDDEYRSQDQIPWSFKDAFETDPVYLDRLHEAVEIDPAFQRAFAALGANDPASRSGAINELWSDTPDGRKVLVEIAESVGGKFTSEDYIPRSAAELASDRGTRILVDTYSDNITGYRYLASLRADEGYEQHSGERLYAGVVQVNLWDAQAEKPQTRFQPALYQEADPALPTLTPLPGRTFIASEVYASRLDAEERAGEYLEAAITPDEYRTLPAAKAPSYGERLDHNLDHVPFISGTTVQRYNPDEPLRFKDILSVTMQSAGPSTSNLAHDLGKMSEPQGYSVLELRAAPDEQIDLSAISQQVEMQFHKTPEKARLLADPVYSGRKDFIERISMALDKREARTAELKALFGVTETASISDDDDIAARYNELTDLEPMNRPVLAKVIDAPTIVPSPPVGPSTRDELHEQISGQLKELDWRNMRNHFGSVGVGSYHDDVFEADSFNLKFIVECQTDEGEPKDDWSVYVQKGDAKPNSWDWNHPIHREDGFKTDEEAMDAAAFYRVEMIIDEMEPPAPAPAMYNQLSHPDADKKVAAVFSEKTPEGTVYRSAAITINNVGFSAGLSTERHSSFAEASTKAVEQLHRELQHEKQQTVNHAAEGHLSAPMPTSVANSI